MQVYFYCQLSTSLFCCGSSSSPTFLKPKSEKKTFSQRNYCKCKALNIGMLFQLAELKKKKMNKGQNVRSYIKCTDSKKTPN